MQQTMNRVYNRFRMIQDDVHNSGVDDDGADEITLALSRAVDKMDSLIGKYRKKK